MPAKTWKDTSDWITWENQDSSVGIRTFSNGMYIPTESSAVTLTGITSQTTKARWRFAQRLSLEDDAGSHDASKPSGFSSSLTEFGLLFNTKNSHVTVAGDSDFALSANTNIAISCWIRGIVTDYSDGMGVIFAYHSGLGDGEIEYAVVIDTDNTIKAKYTDGGVTQTLSPVGGEVVIDKDWHHIFFTIAGDGSSIMLAVDGEGTPSLTSVTAEAASGARHFSLGSSEFTGSTAFGFAGYMDEVEFQDYDATGFTFGNLRFDRNIVLSTVFDTAETDSVLSSIRSDHETTNSSSVTYSFRASNTSFPQDNTDLAWTGFTAPGQIASQTTTDINDLGVFVKGRFQQVRVKLAPSDENSFTPDPLQTVSSVLNEVEINSVSETTLLGATRPAFEPGTVLGQLVNFSGEKVIDKVTLELSVSTTNRSLFHIGFGTTVSFQAVNFTSSRDEWTFQPVLHWSASNNWLTSGTTIQNTLQTEDYDTEEEALLMSPCLDYRIFLPDSGVYDLWGYGYVGGDGIWWTWDNDKTDLRRLNLGLDDSGWIGVPRWTKFGSFFVEEGGLHTFTVYLGKQNTTILDQWYFTTNHSLDKDLDFLGNEGYSTPLPLSRGPFQTIMRLRSLNNEEFADLESPPIGTVDVSSYLNSDIVVATGKFNYAIQNDKNGTGVTYEDGVSIEYWQVGGSVKDFASWDFIFPNNPVGNTISSDDYGQTIQ